MVARFGQVVFWTCSLLAGAIVAGIAYWGLTSGVTDFEGSVFFGVVALVIFLFGRACLYVLAGR